MYRVLTWMCSLRYCTGDPYISMITPLYFFSPFSLSFLCKNIWGYLKEGRSLLCPASFMQPGMHRTHLVVYVYARINIGPGLLQWGQNLTADDFKQYIRFVLYQASFVFHSSDWPFFLYPWNPLLFQLTLQPQTACLSEWFALCGEEEPDRLSLKK